jgi:5-methylcytosine-specific restriction protein B
MIKKTPQWLIDRAFNIEPKNFSRIYGFLNLLYKLNCKEINYDEFINSAIESKFIISEERYSQSTQTFYKNFGFILSKTEISEIGKSIVLNEIDIKDALLLQLFKKQYADNKSFLVRPLISVLTTLVALNKALKINDAWIDHYDYINYISEIIDPKYEVPIEKILSDRSNNIDRKIDSQNSDWDVWHSFLTSSELFIGKKENYSLTLNQNNIHMINHILENYQRSTLVDSKDNWIENYGSVKKGLFEIFKPITLQEGIEVSFINDEQLSEILNLYLFEGLSMRACDERALSPQIANRTNGLFSQVIINGLGINTENGLNKGVLKPFKNYKKLIKYLDFGDIETKKRKIFQLLDLESNQSESSVKKLLDKDFFYNHHKQLILTGAPGTGKTYGVQEFVKKKIGEKVYESRTRHELVQFHPSFDYTDFIEGIRPREENGTIHFVKQDGIFKKFCRRAAHDSNSNLYYFIIDEINRADLSKVFGELMYALEDNYRGPNYRVSTQFQNMKTEGLEGEDIFEQGFFIPENVVIIGTMNDIDRSVESIDFALRRRFRWINIKVSEVLESTLNSIWNSQPLNGLFDKINDLNNIICGESGKKLGLDENYQIGPAYFQPLDEKNLKVYLNHIWSFRIEPLIREYIRGRKSELVDSFIKECKAALIGNDQDILSI